MSDLPCVSGIQAEEGRSLTCSHTRICGPQGSAVDFSCTLPNPDRKQEAFWVAASERGTVDLRTAQLDSQRVQHHCSEDKCTLKIQDLRKDDSATYRVRVKPEQSSVSTDSAGVLLLVTGARLPQRLFYHLCASVLTPSSCFSFTRPDLLVQRSGYYELRCFGRVCQPDQGSYIWYENGKVIPVATTSFKRVGRYGHSYSCAVRGHEDFPSPSFCESTHEHLPAGKLSVFHSAGQKKI